MRRWWSAPRISLADPAFRSPLTRLDEVFAQINGAQRYLWRAVDQHGNVPDILVRSRRNAVAAKKLFRRLRKGLR